MSSSSRALPHRHTYRDLGDFLLELRRQFQPGKPAEIVLGKAFRIKQSIRPISAMEWREVIRDVSSKLDGLRIRGERAGDMIDFLNNARSV